MKVQEKKTVANAHRNIIGEFANMQELRKEMNRRTMEALRGVDLSFIAELSKR